MAAHPISFVLMLWFFGTWVGSALVWPATIVAAFYGNYVPLYIMLAYIGIRTVVKPTYKEWLHHACSKLMTNYPYFREQNTIVEEEIKEGSKSLISIHPHGILCCGWSVTLNMSPKLLSAKMHLLVTEVMFKLPFTADMLSWFRFFPATKSQMLQHMKQGHNLALLPGGYQEATLYKRGSHRVFIKERKGFVKYCLQNGYKIHPAYNFGEEQTYMAASWLQEKLIFLNNFKMPAVVFLGKYVGILPNDDIALTTVVGKGLKLPWIENPTKAQVDEWHGKYMVELQSLFNRHKAKYAAEGEAATLELL